jgi:hypothetical protein
MIKPQTEEKEIKIEPKTEVANSEILIGSEIELPEEIKIVESEIELPEDITEISQEDLDGVMPQMNITVPEKSSEQQKEVGMLISDEQYLEVISGIISDIKEDRKQVSDYIDNFAEMVINDGDATTSSKEALVNLVKVKTDLQDKMLKAADLMTRLKIKNTYAYSGPHLNAMQQNNFNLGPETSFDKKELIKAINQVKKKKKE